MRAWKTRLVVLILAVSSLRPQRVGAEPHRLDFRDSGPALESGQDGPFRDAVEPAYRLVEGISDGCYDFVRVNLIEGFLPEGLSRDLPAAPGQDSGAAFSRNLRDQEERFLQRLRESYPVMDQQAGIFTSAQLQGWRSSAEEQQTSLAVNALTDTLLQRYHLGIFARSSEVYVQDRRNWDPGSLAMAGVVGGTVLFLNGLHATVPVDDLRLRIDLRPIRRLQQALHSGGTAQSLASLELGYKDSPLVAALELGVDNGRMRNESVGLKYRLRY